MPKALQFERELLEFAALLKREGVRSYLEIGSKFGGSLWFIAQYLPTGSRIVSVDLSSGDALRQLTDTVQALRRQGFDVHMIVGDSTDPQIIEKVYALGPFDACLIDANHTVPYVRADWSNYSKVTTKLVAFHDINYWREVSAPKKYPIEVPQVWNEIKNGYRHLEIKYDRQDNGFGVVWL